MIGNVVAYVPCVSCERNEMCSMCELMLRRTQREWISVEERLPEVGTRVVGYDYESNVRCYFITEGRWWIDDGWNTAKGWGIAHWMPLPTPPRKEDEGK